MQVQYNERFVEELHLPVEKLDFGQGKPVVPAADAVMSHAGPPVARPLLQQDAQQDQPLLTPMLPFAQVMQFPCWKYEARHACSWPSGCREFFHTVHC